MRILTEFLLCVSFPRHQQSAPSMSIQKEFPRSCINSFLMQRGKVVFAFSNGKAAFAPDFPFSHLMEDCLFNFIFSISLNLTMVVQRDAVRVRSWLKKKSSDSERIRQLQNLLAANKFPNPEKRPGHCWLACLAEFLHVP